MEKLRVMQVIQGIKSNNHMTCETKVAPGPPLPAAGTLGDTLPPHL